MLTFTAAVSASDFNEDAVENATDKTTSFEDVISENENKEVNLSAKEQFGIYGNSDTSLKVFVRDSEGKNVSEGSVTFVDVFGKNYTANVNNGVASSKVFISQTGEFNITCNYFGNGLFNDTSTTFLLKVPVAETHCRNILATRYDNTVYFSGNMISDYKPYQKYGDFDDFEEVTEGYLNVYIDGVNVGRCGVDVNGNFVYVWNTTRNLIGETINFTAYFRNDLNHFKASNFTKNFTFDFPKDTKIITQVDTGDVTNIIITGTVQDSFNNAVVGGTITIDDTYIVPVDAKGNFKFYLTGNEIHKSNYEIGVFDWGSKADITVNIPLMNGLDHTPLTDELINLCQQGSPYIKFGNGNGKTIIVNVGTHGGEIAPIVAGFKLINHLATYGGEINGTIYVFPVLFPQATANNTRIFNYTNLNVIAHINGTISNSLIKFAQSVNASGIGDFHATRHSDSDVGITCAMCTIDPTYESFQIASFISDETGYDLKKYDVAGIPYAGAIEDYSNMLGIPAVTCEVLTNHGAIEWGSPEKSFNMMKSFLKYFGFDIEGMSKIPFKTIKDLALKFTSPYGYNSSSTVIGENLLRDSAQIIAKTSTYVINYGGKYSITLKNSNGDAIAFKKVTFVLNGKNIGSATTNEKGIASIQLTSKILKTVKYGKKNLIINFNDNNYKKISKSVKITVNKEKTKFIAKSKTFKKSLKNKKYVVILKNSKNKAIKNVKVFLKVNGKKYSAKTNSKGKATFKITKLSKKGKFKSTLTYKGNSYYYKLTKKVKINIK